MTPDLTWLLYSVILAFLMELAASAVRVQIWTPAGFMLALGNRENLPAASPLAGRADRAARNMMVSLLLFSAVLLAAHAAGKTGDRITLGAELFFFARLAYAPLYWLGIAYLRTAAWTAGIVGIGIIASAMF